MAKRKTAPAIHPFDQLHHTDTSGLIPGPEIAKGTSARPSELTAYYGVAPSILHGLLDIWLHRTTPHPIEQTVFLDVGAGKGRAMLLASQFPFLRIEGIELNPDLALIARANISIWENDLQANALAPLILHNADATTHPLPTGPTLAFLFHPFELPILRRFLRHVETSITNNPNPFDLFYVNAEHDSYLDRHPAFTRLWTGLVPMSPADHLADLAAIAQQKEYGSTGDELCAIYRFTGRK
ncbi:MAG: class I SAM-dependent methyltransferase [Acidobacteriaceae bacterium]